MCYGKAAIRGLGLGFQQYREHSLFGIKLGKITSLVFFVDPHVGVYGIFKDEFKKVNILLLFLIKGIHM